MLQQTVRMLSRPPFSSGVRLEVSAWIGAALVGGPHRRRVELFAEADIALYDAKAASRNRVHLIGDEKHRLAA